MLLTTIGQWMQEDPIQQEGGQSNFREYVGNDPANATDPSGLQTSLSPEDAQKFNQNAKDIKLLSSALKFDNVKAFKKLQEERIQLSADLSSGQNPETKKKYTKAEIAGLLS